MTPPLDIAALRTKAEEVERLTRCMTGASIRHNGAYEDLCVLDDGEVLARSRDLGATAYLGHHAKVAEVALAVPVLCDRVEEAEREAREQRDIADLWRQRAKEARESIGVLTEGSVMAVDLIANQSTDLAAASEENARLLAEVERLKADLADDDGWFYSWCCDNNGITPGPGFYPAREDTIARAARSGPEERGGARSFFLFRVKRLDLDEVFVDDEGNVEGGDD